MFKILIVEDDSELRGLFKRVLVKNGYSVRTASNGAEALDLVGAEYIDLIISDIMMPVMDGYAMVSSLREAGYQMPVMMITAKDAFDDMKLGFLSGSDDYMVKPINVNEMVLRVGALLRRAEMMNERRQTFGSTEILQTDFVSNVSHEFKTPINAIEGYTMLLQDTVVSEEQNEYVEKILYNTKRLSELVGSILLLSKLENKGIQNRFEFFCLDEQIRKAIVSLEHKWTAKNIEFDADMETIVYRGNESLLYHVFANLIDNAIKFNRDGGKITVRLEKQETNIVFSVSDEGPGIDDNAKNHIFDKFYQVNNSHSGEGNGLGLALVKRILDIHKGSIEVNNNEDGIGCTFTVTLPR